MPEPGSAATPENLKVFRVHSRWVRVQLRQAPAAKEMLAATAPLAALSAAQQRDNALDLRDERVGVGFGDSVPALGRDRVDEGPKGIDGRDVVVLVDVLDRPQRGAQLRNEAVFNFLPKVEGDDRLDNVFD